MRGAAADADIAAHLRAGLAKLSQQLGEALGELPVVDVGVDELPDACARLDHEALLKTLRGNLSEMALAQSYQDLSGQVIKKVAGIVRNVHDQLAAMGLPPTGTNRKAGTNALAGSGSSVAVVDRPAASQRDADELLSNLGL